jgi:hypothetical protein
MTQPTVCAVMLVNGRPEMVKRAVASFRAQTYDPTRRFLLVFDSGKVPVKPSGCDSENEERVDAHALGNVTIGRLRNEANETANHFDIIVHWDSDDVSHPRRIEEQVALLQASGKACVGYRDALFWDTRANEVASDIGTQCSTPGVSWLYSNPDPRYCLGASMCYWREAWEAMPFQDNTYGDEFWRRANQDKCLGVSAIDSLRLEVFQSADVIKNDGDPRLVCGIHGANSSTAYSAENMRNEMWRRAPEWDGYAGKVMAL